MLAELGGPVVNLCCGTNPLGDLRVDQLHQADDSTETATNLLADARNLPLPRNSVAGIVIDPPWKVAPGARIRFLSEAHRITKPGGRIIHNSWWVPYHPYADLERVVPVTANVLESSLGGPGGLSFLTSLIVREQPDLGADTYTLASHLDETSVDAIDRLSEFHSDIRQPGALDPRSVPRPSTTPVGNVVLPGPICRPVANLEITTSVPTVASPTPSPT